MKCASCPANVERHSGPSILAESDGALRASPLFSRRDTLAATLASHALARALCALALLSACNSDPATVSDASVSDAAVVPEDTAPWSCPRVRPAVPATVPRCNGSAALCDRRFDQVAYATTHNAMSSEERAFASPNQRFSITRQLRDGVRGLMLDVHPWRDETWLCHGTCLAGAQRHVEGLCEIAQFLDANPAEVVTLIYESYVPGASVVADFRSVGLDEDAFTQRAGDAWPTLGEMVRGRRRLVVLTDRDDDAAPWYMNVWTYAQENPFAARVPADLSCASGRGRSTNALFILNHFLTAPLASPELAAMVNGSAMITEHARRCEQERMRMSNFVTVDFYDIGDVLPVVTALNAR